MRDDNVSNICIHKSEQDIKEIMFAKIDHREGDPESVQEEKWYGLWIFFPNIKSSKERIRGMERGHGCREVRPEIFINGRQCDESIKMREDNVRDMRDRRDDAILRGEPWRRGGENEVCEISHEGKPDHPENVALEIFTIDEPENECDKERDDKIEYRNALP